MKKFATLIVLLAMALPALVAQEPEQEEAEQEVQKQEAPAEIQEAPAEKQESPAEKQESPAEKQESPAEKQEAQKKEGPARKQQRNPGEVQTLFDPHSGSGGYGAFTIGYTQVAGRDALLMGGRGEWVVGHGFGLGMAGYGFVNDPIYNSIDQLNYSLAGGYGGLIMEPILFGWFPVHLSFPILVGAGGVASTSYSSDWYDPYEYWDGYLEDAAAFFVAEVGVEVEFNLVRFFRLAVFGSYRYTSDIIMENTPSDALKGWSAGMTFKFGSF